jgi:hypothetical protein
VLNVLEKEGRMFNKLKTLFIISTLLSFCIGCGPSSNESEFYYRQAVQIDKGFYRGQSGIVIEEWPNDLFIELSDGNKTFINKDCVYENAHSN